MNVPIEAIYELGVSHNKFPLPLPDGTLYPEYWPASDTRPLEFLKHFDRVRDKPWADCTFLDLGCGEGATTFGISQTGATVFGVEGRADGVHRANVLRDILGFDRTHFAVGNVIHEESFREVDGILNAGILYHLDDPLLFLERCARNARSFMYVDAAHRPRSEEEWQAAKHKSSFGKAYQIEWHGLRVDVMDYAEPKQAAEKADGIRRPPRASIGNMHSVWLAHRGLVGVMAQLGFPHHEIVADIPHLSRVRTCFFRDVPPPIRDLGPLARPLPRVEAPKTAISNARNRDIAYLRRQGRPVLVLGQEPLLSRVVDDLRTNRIAMDASIAIGERYSMNSIRELLSHRAGGLVVVAVRDVRTIATYLMLLDKFDYVFTSFSMACSNKLDLRASA